MGLDFGRFRFVLAPMAGYTDAAFRLLCKEHGAQLTVTELISAESIVRGNKQGFELAFVSDDERKLGSSGIQLFGSNPKSIANAAAMLEKNADFIDLNFGCPAPKVTRNMGGAALLAKPELIAEIVETVSGSIKKPVTAKTRLGINDSDGAVQIAKTIERAGASALFVHARTLKQGYSGEPDWNKISEIKKSISIPVFGNGNVCSYADAERMLNTTNCDGVMIGRAALGNPYVFEMCRTKRDFEVTAEMRRAAFFRYIELREKLNMRESLGDVKAQAITFVQGVHGAAELRNRIGKAKEKEEIMVHFCPRNCGL